LTTTKDKYKEVKERIEKAKSDFVALGRKLLQELTDEFFEKYPDVEGFAWQQYTPGFCDGDPCYFRVDDYAEALVLKVDGDWDYDMRGEWGETREVLTFDVDEVRQDAIEIVNSIDEDILKELFGDPVEVQATREGFDACDTEVPY
jgi:hypothetical protein